MNETTDADARAMTHDDVPSWSAILLVVALVAITWFHALGDRPLAEPDEGRYAEIPREMVASGDWLTPRLNGFKYFEKPALQYWLTAAGYEVFGQHEWVARLWPALLGFVGALWAGFLGLRLYGRATGYYAFLITASSLLYFALGHILTLDMSFSVSMALGVGALILAQRQREERPRMTRNWMLFGWAMLALAVLTKGLAGVVLPGAAVFLYMLWQRDWTLFKSLHLFKGLVLVVLITAPWFIEVSRQNPNFAWFFFVHEHFERYLTTVHHRDAPIWYFVPLFALGGMPWLVSWLRGILQPFATRFEGAEAGRFDAARLIWVYAAFIFVFFSLGHSKLPAYIVPIFPMLAVLAGRALARRENFSPDALALALFGLFLIVTGTQAERFATETITVEMLRAYRDWFFLAGAVLFCVGLITWVMDFRSWLKAAAIALSAMIGYQLLFAGYPTIGKTRTSDALAAAIRPLLQPDTPVYSVGVYPQSLPFYLRRKVKLVQYMGELEMGIDQEPERYIATVDAFLPQWRRQPHAIAILGADDAEALGLAVLGGRVIYQDEARVAVARP